MTLFSILMTSFVIFSSTASLAQEVGQRIRLSTIDPETVQIKNVTKPIAKINEFLAEIHFNYHASDTCVKYAGLLEKNDNFFGVFLPNEAYEFAPVITRERGQYWQSCGQSISHNGAVEKVVLRDFENNESIVIILGTAQFRLSRTNDNFEFKRIK